MVKRSQKFGKRHRDERPAACELPMRIGADQVSRAFFKCTAAGAGTSASGPVSAAVNVNAVIRWITVRRRQGNVIVRHFRRTRRAEHRGKARQVKAASAANEHQ